MKSTAKGYCVEFRAKSETATLGTLTITNEWTRLPDAILRTINYGSLAERSLEDIGLTTLDRAMNRIKAHYPWTDRIDLRIVEHDVTVTVESTIASYITP